MAGGVGGQPWDELNETPDAMPVHVSVENQMPEDLYRAMGSFIGSSPLSGVTQVVLGPFPEGEQEQSEDDYLEADCSAPLFHY